MFYEKHEKHFNVLSGKELNNMMQKTRWIIPVMFLSCIQTTVAAERLCRERVYNSSNAERLDNHLLHEFTTHSNSECAMTCLTMSNRCVSFNWNEIGKICQLNNAGQNEYPSDVKASKQWKYYDIDNNYKGKCVDSPCANNGRCEPSCGNEHRFICHCLDGFTGRLCQISEDWQLIFKAVSGITTQDTDEFQIDPYKVWERQEPYNENVTAAKQLDISFKDHYKSSFALDWQTRNIQQVIVGLFDEAGKELFHLIFNGVGSDSMNWFSKDRLISSPWTDLLNEPQNFFSVFGENSNDDQVRRRWYISRNHGGCHIDTGWLIVSAKNFCPWENTGATGANPTILYSKLETVTNWSTEQNVGEAAIFAIFVKTN